MTTAQNVCGEPYWPEPGHQHRCTVPRDGAHEIGTAPGLSHDSATDIHRCACGFTWVVD